MVIRSSKPASCFLGIQPGHKHFRDLAESRQIHEIEGIVIYRFSSNLFFANAGVLQQDIEQEIERRGNIKAVILDASGIGSIDITAADRLEILYKSFKEQEIKFYITEHIAGLNEQMRKLGIGYLIEEGCVRRTIHIALKDMGIKRPYPLEGGVDNEERSASRKRVDNRMQEFVWAFGSETEDQIEKQITRQIEQLKQNGNVENLLHGRWSHMEAFDEDEWLEHLEEHLKEIVNISGKDEIDNSIENVWSVLFMTGYLTRTGNDQSDVYQLIIPNKEVREVFVLQIKDWFGRIVADSRASVEKINYGFLEGKTEDIQQELTMFLGETISILDTKARNDEKEIFYHGILSGILKNYSGWAVKSNKESGDGFADILLKPKNPDAGIIIELKYARSMNELDNACKRALEQIRERRYDAELREDGRSDILAYGIAFCKKRCKVVVEKL